MNQEELERLLKSSPVLRFMHETGVPLNRENYIDFNWWGEAPTGDDWTAEHELDPPLPFRRGYPFGQ